MSYIGKNELYEVLKRVIKELWDSGKTREGCVVSDAVEAIKDAIRKGEIPQRELRNGEWEKANANGFLVCSACHNCYVANEWISETKWRYCPSCGATMNVEREGTQQ